MHLENCAIYAVIVWFTADRRSPAANGGGTILNAAQALSMSLAQFDASSFPCCAPPADPCALLS
jgi:hypothetical protein